MHDFVVVAAAMLPGSTASAEIVTGSFSRAWVSAGIALMHDVEDQDDEEEGGDDNGGHAVEAKAGLGAMASPDARGGLARREIGAARRSGGNRRRGYAQSYCSLYLCTMRSATTLSISVKKNRTKPSANAESVLTLSNS